jgi:hypothetical protein
MLKSATALAAYLAAAIALIAGAAHAQQRPDAFDALVAEGSPACVPMIVVKQIADGVENLDANQFQFVRALFIAIPPMSSELPPGDRAWIATSGDRHMLGLEGDALVGGLTVNATCARFMVPKPIVDMLIEVGAGAIGGQGKPL